MSVKENPCRKFQANIFNKSKCQNCFQPRESHLLNDEDLRQAKPIYGGWLLLAPEGTDFDNPLHRTRKWQRRFFILYEHGLLRYALDEMPGTLPQGTIDMNRCSDVMDAESRTAQKNSLCVLTPGKEHFLRAECKETINGWQEALSVYPRSNKRNQKKKRKVEPPALQEPGPAKVTVTGGGDGIPRLPGGIAGAEHDPMGRATSRQEEKRRIRATPSRGASSLCQSRTDSAGAAQDDGGAMSAGRKAPAESRYFSLEKTESEPSPKPAQNCQPLRLAPGYASEAKVPISLARPGYSAIASSRTSPDCEANDETPSWEGRRAAGRGGAASATRGGAGACAMTSREAFGPEKKRADLRARTQSPGREEVARLFGEERRRSRVIGRFEESPNAERTDTSGCGEPSSDVSNAGKERRVPDASGCAFANLRQAKSLDCGVTGSAVTPRLLNVKKGWMTKLDEDGTWKKHWFVLTDQSLRYYKDSLAEEASDADGEIDLSTCSDVQEFPVQRNYGFRILCRGGARTLSAMTSGIRRNWIQAIVENARAAVAPDDARKNISLKLSVLKPRSVPEVNPEGRAPPEPRQGVRPEPSPRPEPPDAVGRSKTSDRSRFQIDQTGEPAKERADAVRRGPSLSATASRRSSPSSSSPSPVPASPIEDDVSRPPNVLLPKSPAQPSLPESPQRGRMRVDRPAALRDVEGETCGVASSAREEIERRWLRVETTPLREEKQVAIGASSENSHADGLPAQRLAALLRKELGQKQEVLEQLQRQNSVFQEQLEDALGREQSARHGYVLQSATAPSSSPRRVPPQHSHKLNRDLRSALESPQREQVLARRQIQMLEKNPTEAQTATDRREANVEAPRSRPASASAEISASERAVARVRDELESERDRTKEQEEERGRTEATLRAQRKDGESRLREVEASLWERSRALRHPEHQRALRRDHAREIQRLRGRLREVTARLLATEEGRALTEQRLRKERRGLRESHERERQSLRRRIAEAEAGLLEAKRQLEALLGGWRGSAGRERGERSPKPRREPTPTSDAFESPRESVRRLEEEKGLLARRCQQLLEQTAEADREVGKLRARLETQRADYCTLENSYERATRESRRMSRSLREKEEEILQTEAVYRSLLESKEEDLKEALVKMSALGNDLEETERKLQAKEDLLSLTGRRVSDRVEADAARQNLKAELAAAEKRVAELRRHLGALRPGCADPGWSQPGRNREGDQTFTSDGESPLSFGAASRTEDSADDDESRAKQTAVPFSDARLHARHHPGDRRSFDHARNQRDFDLAQALTRAERAGDSDELMSIVRAPETKPLATEEKLKSLTRTRTNEPGGCESVPGIAAGTAAHAEALLCVETSRQKVKEAFLSGSRDRARSPLRPLSEVRRELSRASAHIRRGQKTSEEQSPCRPATKTVELSQQEAVPLFAQTLSFEALVLDEMALLVRTSESDLLLQTLTAIREDVENIQSGDDDCLAVVYADVLTRKLMSETTVRREEPEREAKPRGGVSNEANARAEAGVNASAVFHALVKAELSYSVRNLKLDYQGKLRLLEGELAEARRELSQRERALKAIIEASERADWKSAIREAEADFGFGPASPAVVCPPELAPYAERIRLQEARDLAEKVVERRLADEMPPGDPAEPLQSARESLAVELQQQAAKLRKYAEEIRSSRSHPELAQTLSAALRPRASHPFTSASLCMREALVQSQVAYVACRLRAAHKRNSARCQETRRSADAPARRRAGCGGAVREKCETSLPGEHFHMRVEEPKHREESRDATRPAPSEGATDSRQRPKEDPPADANAAKERHRNRVKKLKDDFEGQIAQLRRIRRDEAVGSHPAPGQSIAKLRLNGSHRRVASSPTEAGERQTVSEGDAAGLLKDRIRQLEAQMNALRDQLENERLDGDVAGLRVKYQRDSESLKATCERGFAAMEETHHKVVEDLQRRHQREISKLTEERERLLAEETAATVAAIEAMKNAHEEELEKNRRSQLSGLDADIDQLRLQYREELRSVQRELEVLSEQYSQKCLENAHLAQALEAERQALGQCQRENRELEAHNQELNGRLSAEIARMRSCLSGETALSPVTPGKDVYELEVLLRVKESEIQYLKREIHSLKDELQSALRDKKYAADKHKDIYAELSVAKAKADCDIGKLKEKLHIATQALGDGTVWSGYDILKSKSNPDFTKKEQTTTSEPSTSVRSKSLKEGLTVQERTKMFQAKESEKI